MRLRRLACAYAIALSAGAAIFGMGAISASAHEVYVLDGNEIAFDLKAPQPDFVATIESHLGQFAFWGVVVGLLIAAGLFISLCRPIERMLGPALRRIKPFAPHIAQATLGLSLLASGWYHAIYGVELPLDVVFGSLAHIASWVLMATGAMLLFGILPRLAALISVAVFVALISKYGFYMLNYGTYLGEALVIALFGGAHTMLANRRASAFFTKTIPAWAHEYSFLVMRVLFGASLIYASLYAKLFHGALALDVVARYHLTQYFPFDPTFLVLGAMIVEVLLGLCFVIGLELRFASLFFLGFLCLSIGFFGEAVWPHIVLIGTALAMFAHGYDRTTLLVRLEKDKSLEPVL